MIASHSPFATTVLILPINCCWQFPSGSRDRRLWGTRWSDPGEAQLNERWRHQHLSIRHRLGCFGTEAGWRGGPPVSGRRPVDPQQSAPWRLLGRFRLVLCLWPFDQHPCMCRHTHKMVSWAWNEQQRYSQNVAAFNSATLNGRCHNCCC
jgi:hypothetical protein